MYSPIIKDVNVEILDGQIVKEISFSLEHLHPDDFEILREIGDLDGVSFPMLVAPWPGGWRIELERNDESRSMLSEADIFSDGFRALCDIAYQHECRRILIIRSMVPTPGLPTYKRR